MLARALDDSLDDLRGDPDVRQNDPTRSIVAPWSLRATAWPTVSMPVTWEEVERGGPLVFDWRDVPARLSAWTSAS